MLPGEANSWQGAAAGIADAFQAQLKSVYAHVRYRLVTDVLAGHFGKKPVHIVDIGGGVGLQAILLARLGHSVTIVEQDPVLVNEAKRRISHLPASVGGRLSITPMTAQEALRSGAGSFDAACCHSVLMYQSDPRSFIQELLRFVRTPGWVSVADINPGAEVRRIAFKQKWSVARNRMRMGAPQGTHEVEIFPRGRDAVAGLLDQAGARVVDWHGIGCFCAHLNEQPADGRDDLDALVALEAEAGRTSPHREAAHLYHIVARTGGQG